MSGDPIWRAIQAQGLAVPPAVQNLHAGQGTRHFAGRCHITRGRGVLVWCVLKLAGFPAGGKEVPIRLTIKTNGDHSQWRRDFDGHVTTSHLGFDAAHHQVTERFGPIRLRMTLDVATDGLSMGITQLRVFGVPMPAVLIPRSDTREYQDANGQFRFDVAARMPGLGLLIRYAGYLRPA